ncbi:alkylated DNA repair protein ALKBH6 homolog isoform X2 [Ziziphus jujuba]|uniref:Alkylated DNA repair protein ALKBH6 homolog isoform X2 n=1 Tax=Ziziphus jujuba TaxID=326968 RepID=A0ABM3IB93_ZIZJJ|nr:alkylated DNA repair protein ALKBH6 homolog isoform X2 [Ziziphus jujuba]
MSHGGMEGNDILGDFKIGSLPTLIYIPDFVTESEQTALLNKIYEAPVSKWKSVKNRRLQNWGGVVHEKGLVSQELPSWLTKITQKVHDDSGMFPLPINHVLVNEYLPDQGIMPHQDGPAYFPVVAILSLGSPVVMDFTPHLSLRFCTSTWTNNVKDRSSNKGALDIERVQWLDNHSPFSVLLMPRSLLIFKDKAYSDYLHGIKDVEVQSYNGVINEVEAVNEQVLDHSLSKDVKSIQRTTNRVSLTCRSVLKVHKNLFKI